MNKKVKYSLTAAAIVIILVVFLYQKTKPLQVEAMVAVPTDIEITFKEDGILKSNEEFQIISQVTGTVKEVFVKPDTYIEAGTELAVIDTKAYEDQVRVYENNIVNHEAGRQLDISQLGIEQKQVDLGYKKDTYDKNIQLYQGGYISQQEFSVYEQDYLSLKNTINQLKEQKLRINESYDALIQGERQSIEKMQEKIRNCTIRSEKSGYITELPIQNMSSLQETNVVCVIKEKLPPVIESYVITEDVVSLSVGDQVEITQSTREKELKYTGVIKEIANWAIEQTSALGTSEHRVKVTIEPVEPIETAGSGYNLDVKYVIYRESGCIVLPSSAFFNWNEEDYVYILHNNRIRATPVKKGMSSSSEVVVTEGISDGDIVIKNIAEKDIVEGKKATWKG
ncbi:MAG: efflux RND transporter periplasmic adaptor subunit [Hungatella sp.]|jgi:HlyD family secretion protein|nr:efflux RND transporter periplasmic adaptor subunit [Hungatella sp.]